MNISKEIKQGKNTFEVCAHERDQIIIQRHFIGHTELDLKIQDLAISSNPLWLNIAIRLIRTYQRRIAPSLGNRCVFDPSCSHYSELAFRSKGFLKGAYFTLKRLHRCRPKNGGVDLIIK